MSNHTTNEDTAIATPTWQVVALWIIVGVPTLWGFIETLRGALRLFTS